MCMSFLDICNHTKAMETPFAQFYHVVGSSRFVLFCLFAFAMEIRFLLVLATGAQGRKTLTDLSRNSSE